MNNVGLSIVEGVANGSSAYRDPSKRNIGLLMQSVRGVPFQPTKIQSLEEFNTIFGGQDSTYFGPATVKAIFDQAGNAEVTLYLARALGGAYAASTKSGSLGAATVTVKAGYRGEEDPGVWGDDLLTVLYSKGFKSKDAFLFVVYYKGVQVESYSYATLAEVQDAVNRISKYVVLDVSAEVPVTYDFTMTGTITTSTASNEVTGAATAFTTELAVGDVLFGQIASIAYPIGTIASIESNTKLTLVSKAFAATTGTWGKRVDSSLSLELEGGSNGTTVEADFYPSGTSENPTGLSCFDGYDIQLLAVTENHTLSMAKQVNDYVNTVKQPIGLVNLPITADIGTAELWAMELQTSQVSYLASIMGWAKVSDNVGNLMYIPMLGLWLGAGFLRTPYMNGNFIHIPPAGIDSILYNVVDVTPKRLSQSAVDKIVRDFTCNVVQYLDTVGFYVASSRTYSTDPLYMSIHVRQQTSYYKKVLVNMLRYMEQKPNTPELKREALIDLRTFFKQEYDNGALERSVPFETAYVGISDRSNNPTGQDRKVVNITVLWIPTECTESVNISLQRNDSVLTVTE